MYGSRVRFSLGSVENSFGGAGGNSSLMHDDGEVLFNLPNATGGGYSSEQNFMLGGIGSASDNPNANVIHKELENLMGYETHGTAHGHHGQRGSLLFEARPSFDENMDMPTFLINSPKVASSTGSNTISMMFQQQVGSQPSFFNFNFQQPLGGTGGGVGGGSAVNGQTMLNAQMQATVAAHQQQQQQLHHHQQVVSQHHHQQNPSTDLSFSLQSKSMGTPQPVRLFDVEFPEIQSSSLPRRSIVEADYGLLDAELEQQLMPRY